jgi:hypothetical protein
MSKAIDPDKVFQEAERQRKRGGSKQSICPMRKTGVMFKPENIARLPAMSKPFL